MRKTLTLPPLLLLLFVLSSPVAYPQNMAQNSSPKPKRDINAVLASHDAELLTIPDVVGVYVGTMQGRRTLCLKVVLARKNPQSQRKIPRMIEGYPVIMEVTGEIQAKGTPSSGQRR